MPFEPIFGLPFEAASDLPGWSLTGGPDGEQPILAERVAAQLRRLDDRLQELTDSFGDYPALIQAGVENLIALDISVSSGFYNSNYWRGERTVVFDTSFGALGAPAVNVCAVSTVPGTVIECTASSVGSSSFQINIARSNQTATSVMWIATARTDE